MSKYILGIDQGGSKTVAAISDIYGNILGVGKSGGGSHYASGIDMAMSLIKTAVDAAVAHAGIGNTDFHKVYAGLSGADFRDEYDMLTDSLEKTLRCANIHVVNDCIIAMRTGITRREGAILCAGTGLNCAVRNAVGDEFIFGYYIDDMHQGGGALGMQALNAVFSAESMVGAKTILTDRVLAHFGMQSVDALLQAHVMNTLDADNRKTLTYVLDECSEAGDSVALAILEGFGRACYRYFEAGLRKLDMANPALELVLSGGVFKCKNPIMLNTIRELVALSFPNVRIVEARLEPVAGAIMLGLDSLSERGVLTDDVLCNIQNSCARHGLIRKPEITI